MPESTVVRSSVTWLRPSQCSFDLVQVTAPVERPVGHAWPTGDLSRGDRFRGQGVDSSDDLAGGCQRHLGSHIARNGQPQRQGGAVDEVQDRTGYVIEHAVDCVPLPTRHRAAVPESKVSQAGRHRPAIASILMQVLGVEAFDHALESIELLAVPPEVIAGGATWRQRGMPDVARF